MDSKVRVRFAPSPTGPLHIGGLRTALFNYLFAKQNRGAFILRIEDTDQNRFVEGAESYIAEALDWCGLHLDESPTIGGAFGPYRQSERTEFYKKAIDELLHLRKAYYAFDTPETLDFHRKDHEEKGKTFVYNWHNRLKLKNSLSLEPNEVEKLLKNGTPYVIRFKMVEDATAENTIDVADLIRGSRAIDLNLLDDKILFKSDGLPTYHLANVVDDHAMKISHVIRGEEWLPSLALHLALYKAFGWEPPQFAHLPLLLKPTGKGKLSKRDGEKMGFPVFPLNWKDSETGHISVGFREAGYLPNAVVNFLALLGWNPGDDREIFDMNSLINAFDLEKVNKAGARFDPEKNRWFNQQYLQNEAHDDLVLELKRQLEKENIETQLDLGAIVCAVRSRCELLTDLITQARFFFSAPKSYDEKALTKQRHDTSIHGLQNVITLLESQSLFEAQAISNTIKSWAQKNETALGKFLPALRLALVGNLSGPDLFETMAILGKAETISRISNFIHLD